MKMKLKLVAVGGVIAALWHQLTQSQDIVLANTVPARAGCRDSKLADAAIGRFTLVKPGSDADHVNVCGAADIPCGITEDSSASAAEERLAYATLGLSHEDKQGIASGDIADGNMLVPAAGGKLKVLPVAAGTYYIVGRAKGGAADTKPVVFTPCFPVQRVVA